MDTATAAQQAGVTVATIRTWCRIGAIAAKKVARRWVITTSSLARRIEIGRKTPMPHTMAAKGTEYIAAWPAAIARQHHLSPEHTAEAMIRAGLAGRDDEHPLRSAFLREQATEQVAALTPAAAKAVSAELAATGRELRAARKTHCHYCGLPYGPSGECSECGDA